MIPYIGDFAEDASVVHYFNTFSSDDPAASVTITNLADTDIYVYKDGSVTDLVTDGASVVIDFDSRTGVHKITIDTSAHADYAVGSDYMVLVEGTTIDAGTVTAALFTFSIENRYNAAADDLANGTDGLGAIKADTAAILTDTGTTIPGTIATAQADLDIITGATGVNLLAATQASIDAIEADTSELQSDDVPGLIAALDAVVDTVKGDTAAILVDTGTTLSATLTTIDSEVGSVKAVTDQMVFTKANELDVNTQSINGAAVVGDGNATPWDGA